MAKQRKLTPERKALITQFLQTYQPEDANGVQAMLKDLLGDTLQGMLETELEDELGYFKYDYKNKDNDNSRNSYSKKTVTSTMGDIDFDIPRDRNGDFEPCYGRHYFKWHVGKPKEWSRILEQLFIYFEGRISLADVE